MPNPSKGPRLYLQRGRGWAIRDGSRFIRTGCAEGDIERARELLGKYIARKYEPEASPQPLIADVLLAYTREVLPLKKTARDLRYRIGSLARWWGERRISDVTAAACRAYEKSKTSAAARVDLKYLQSAIHHWHREHGPLAFVPRLTLPAAPAPRTRFLNRHEAARLLWAARRTPHLARFILLGLYTGSRPGVLLALRWDQVILKTGILHRRPEKAAHASNKRAPPVRLGRRILTHLRRWQRLDSGRTTHIVHFHGQKIGNLRHAWLAACERAGLGREVVPHSLRHTRATWLMQKGAPAWDVAGHLGMTVKTLEATYGHHHPDFQSRVADL